VNCHNTQGAGNMEYIIRLATEEDTPAILELVKEFHDEIANAFGVECDDKMVSERVPLMTTMLLEEDKKIVGLISGLKTTHIVGIEPLMLEVLWYVSSKHRKKGIELYKGFVQLCKDMGMKQIIMSNMGNSKMEIFERFYLSEGYKLLEVQYIKNLQED